MNAQEAADITQESIMNSIMYEIEGSAKTGQRSCTYGCFNINEADRNVVANVLRSLNFKVVEDSSKLIISW